MSSTVALPFLGGEGGLVETRGVERVEIYWT